MAQYNKTGRITLIVDGAYPRGTRVKQGATYRSITVAGATDDDLGVLCERSTAAGQQAAIFHRREEGTVEMIAAGAIAFGATVYPAANGQVSATASGNSIGTNVGQPATAANDYVEILRK